MSGLINERPRFAVEDDKIFDYEHNHYMAATGELDDGDVTWDLDKLKELILAGKQTHDARYVPPAPEVQALIDKLSEQNEEQALELTGLRDENATLHEQLKKFQTAVEGLADDKKPE